MKINSIKSIEKTDPPRVRWDSVKPVSFYKLHKTQLLLLHIYIINMKIGYDIVKEEETLYKNL